MTWKEFLITLIGTKCFYIWWTGWQKYTCLYVYFLCHAAGPQQFLQTDLCDQRTSDQPAYPRSLIRVYAVRMKKMLVLGCPYSAQRWLWSGCTGWSVFAGRTCHLCRLAVHWLKCINHNADIASMHDDSSITTVWKLKHAKTLRTLGKISADDILKYFFLIFFIYLFIYFFRKTSFDISCQWRQFAWIDKSCFLGKVRTNISHLSSAEIALRMVKVKHSLRVWGKINCIPFMSCINAKWDVWCFKSILNE